MATITTTTVTTLAELKAAATGNVSIVYDASLWTWTTGNYSARANDPLIAQSDANPLTTGAWVRQETASIAHKARNGGTASTLETDLARHPVYMERYGVVGYPSEAAAIAAGDQKAAVDRAKAAAQALGRPLILPPGWISLSNFELYNGAKLVGCAQSTSAISHHPGSTDPLFTIPEGVIQGGACSGFQVFGHGGVGEIGFYIWARHSNNSSPAGMWYWNFEDIIAYRFGRKGMWFRGKSDNMNDTVNQFIKMDGVKIFRPTSESECLTITGKCGQFYICGASQFDGGFLGSGVLGDYNVCVSREWRKEDGSPISASEHVSGNRSIDGNQPYSIYISATMQDTDTAILLDNGSLIVDKSNFENCNRCADYRDAAFLTFTNNELRSVGAAANGSITRQISPSSLVAGNNLILGDYASTYICVGNSEPKGFSQIAPDRGISNLVAKPSNMMTILNVSGYNLNIDGHSVASVRGGPNPSNRYSINNITGHVKKFTLVVHDNSYFRLASGGNLYVKGEILLEPRDVCTFEWFDLYQRWQVTSVVR